MLESTAVLATMNGSKYLVQLCKHFAHKIEVCYTDRHGDCRFARGIALLDADENALRMFVRADDEEGLAQTQSIIERHLIRFAFREKIAALDWR